MPCYNPITAYYSPHKNHNGKKPLQFSKSEAFTDREVQIPCGKCMGCRLEYSRQWAVRCVHEASMHKHNAFITLTYNNTNLPKNHSIDVRELQLFFKRLRKKIEPIKIRYFACGEYGEKNSRPHYHAIIFGYDFPDKKIYKTENGYPLYRSRLLEKVWNKGHSLIGEVNFETAAYTARYIMKKRKGEEEHVDENGISNKDYYKKIVQKDGEEQIFYVEKEFAIMSRLPGIGYTWYLKYKDDLKKGYIHVNGKKINIPKYYENKLKQDSENHYERIKKQRRKANVKQKEHNTLERLDTRKRFKQSRIKQLKRKFEKE